MNRIPFLGNKESKIPRSVHRALRGFASRSYRALESTHQPRRLLTEDRLYLAEDTKGVDAERAQAAFARLNNPGLK